MAIGWGDGGGSSSGRDGGYRLRAGDGKQEGGDANGTEGSRTARNDGGFVFFWCVFFFFLARFIHQFSLAGNKLVARFELGGWD